jgi:hypothetical protein
VIKLIVANAMESHGRIWRDHEIQFGDRWPAIKEGCWEPAGRISLVADKGAAHETARGVGLEPSEGHYLLGTKIISSFYAVNIEHRFGRPVNLKGAA